MMNRLQFGTLRPSDVQKGVALLQKQPEAKGPKTLYVVTGKPNAEPAWKNKEVTSFQDWENEGGAVVPPSHPAKARFQADEYLQQADGSFKKVREGVANPLKFQPDKEGDVVHPGFAVAKIARQEGDRLWVEG